jgi:hypothetical protein
LKWVCSKHSYFLIWSCIPAQQWLKTWCYFMCYVWCMMCDGWALYHELFMYYVILTVLCSEESFSDLWNKGHMNMNCFTFLVYLLLLLQKRIWIVIYAPLKFFCLWKNTGDNWACSQFVWVTTIHNCQRTLLLFIMCQKE